MYYINYVLYHQYTISLTYYILYTISPIYYIHHLYTRLLDHLYTIYSITSILYHNRLPPTGVEMSVLLGPIYVFNPPLAGRISTLCIRCPPSGVELLVRLGPHSPVRYPLLCHPCPALVFTMTVWAQNLTRRGRGDGRARTKKETNNHYLHWLDPPRPTHG